MLIWRKQNKEKCKQSSQNWRKQNKEKRIIELRRYRKRHPDRVAATAKRYRDKNLIQRRERNRKYYRENPHIYEAKKKRNRIEKLILRELIAGRKTPLICEICQQPGVIVFDHCHKLNCFRGWICSRCNKVLGQVNDDPNILRLLIRYLEKDYSQQTPISNKHLKKLKLNRVPDHWIEPMPKELRG